MFCEAPVTTARRVTALGAGTGMGRTISWATMGESQPPAAQTAGRLQVVAWALWDCQVHRGSADAIVVTFMFSDI